MAAAHAVLLLEAREVVSACVDGTPVAVVRDEGTTPLVDVIQAPVGYPKLAFIRNYDPYGLIDAAALFEWVLADEGRFVEHVADWTTESEDVEGMLLVHRDGGFVNLGVVENLAEQARRWSDSGRGVQVIRASSLQSPGYLELVLREPFWRGIGPGGWQSDGCVLRHDLKTCGVVPLDPKAKMHTLVGRPAQNGVSDLEGLARLESPCAKKLLLVMDDEVVTEIQGARLGARESDLDFDLGLNTSGNGQKLTAENELDR